MTTTCRNCNKIIVSNTTTGVLMHQGTFSVLCQNLFPVQAAEAR